MKNHRIKYIIQYFGIAAMAVLLCFSCQNNEPNKDSDQTPEIKEVTAKDILGNPDYLAISYGGYRDRDHDIEPTVELSSKKI